MVKANVYLTFDGDCGPAFDFYKKAFGKEFAHISTFGEMPPQDGQPELSDEQKKHIMHVDLPISDETMIFGSDNGPGQPGLIKGNNFSVSLDAGSKGEAKSLFESLSAGGKITMPLQDTFWGAYFGMWEDKFGVNWMVNYDDPTKTQKHP